jgi:hypothetical protein
MHEITATDDADNNNYNNNDDNWTSLEVTKIVQESNHVKSFYLQRRSTESSPWTKDLLPKFRAGQHLPIQLLKKEDDGFTTTSDQTLDRRYSISSSPLVRDYYRISVKRHAHGQSSTYLHDHIQVGDWITVGRPVGDFTLQHNVSSSSSSLPKSIVLMSAGIGITPLLSMLHELAWSESHENFPNIYWIYGARNSQEHPFQKEMQSLQKLFATRHSKDKLHVHTLYSAPGTDDICDQVGRITVSYIQKVVPNLTVDDTTTVLYMCGPLAFLADMETGLIQRGVPSSNIHYETF